MKQTLLGFYTGRKPALSIVHYTHWHTGCSKSALLILALVILSSASAFAQLTQSWKTAPLVVQGQTNDFFVDQALDKANNLLVLGFTGGYSSERRAVLHKVDEAGNVVWSRRYAGEAGSISDEPKGLWIDSKGNSYVMGTSDMAGVYKSFLLRYSPDGALVWSKSFEYSPNVVAYIQSVTVGADDAIYLSGYKTEGDKRYLLTQRLTSDGNVTWEKLFEPEAEDVGGNSDIYVDNKGGVYVTTDFRSFTANYSTTLIKYGAAAGNEIFSKKFGDGFGPKREYSERVMVAPSGNIHLFTFREDTYYAEPFMYTISAGGDLIRRTALGEGAQIRFSPIFYLRDVEFADDGGIILLCTNAIYRDVPDYFIEKYKSDGSRLWIKTLNVYEDGGKIRQFAAKSFSLMANGTIGVIGSYSYFVAPPAWYEDPTYIEKEKLTIALFDQNGNEIWREVNQAHNSQQNYGEGISSNKGNSAYITGSLRGNEFNIFAMKYAPATVAEREAWVSQTHSYDKAAGSITVNWKLHVSETRNQAAKLNVYHSSTENGATQNFEWEMPAGQTSVGASYTYLLSKIGNTEKLVMGVATGTGYKIPNTSAKPKEVQVNVTELTGGTDPVITTSALTSNTICAGSAVSVKFTAEGSFGSGNTFSAQLSNASGSFTNPVIIGSGAGSPINATIPAGTAAGAGYRIRIIASSPATVGTDNGTNITINGAPARPAAISGSTNVCAGAGNLSFSIEEVAGAAEYIWSAPGFTIESGQGSRTVKLKAGTTSGKVSVLAKNACGSSATSELMVNVVQTPSVTITSETSGNVCDGGTITLKATAGSGYTYQWMKNGTVISGATGASLTVSTSGNYTVKVSNSAGCTATSASKEITVNSPFTVNAGENQSVCANAATFTLSGFSPAGGTWSGKGVTAAGSFSPVTAGTGTHTLTYSVTKDNCTVTGTKTITVSPAVTKPGTISGNATVCAGADNLTFSVAEVAGAAEYIWSAPGFEIRSGQGTRSITLKAGNSSGKISVVAKNGCGTSAASEKEVDVTTIPVVAVTAEGSRTVCQGGSVKLTVNAGSGYTIQWTRDGQNLSGATASNYSATESGNYAAIVSKGSCSRQTEPVQITVNAVPSATLAVFQPLCDNASPITLTGGMPAGGTYSGTGVSNGQFDPRAAGAGTHTITYTVAGSGNCTASATQTIVVNTNCGVTGVEDEEPKYKLKLFPNPTSTYVKVELELEKPSNLTIRLLDARGQTLSEQLHQHVQGEFKQSLDLKGRAAGMYLLQFVTGDGVKTRRIIVQ